MYPDGFKGSYHEVLQRLAAKRIICTHCAHQQISDQPIPYQLWFLTSYRGKALWANNRAHLELLIAYLAGERMQFNPDTQAMLETLPQWMILRHNRQKVIHSLRKMHNAR